MLKFKFLLWAFAQILNRKIRSSADVAHYVAHKRLVFQIQTASGAGRHYVLEGGRIRSFAGLAANPAFTFSFRSPAKGFEVLSAKDGQTAFLSALGSKGLTISGDFQEVMWFQGLSALLQPPKAVSPYNRTAF